MKTQLRSKKIEYNNNIIYCINLYEAEPEALANAKREKKKETAVVKLIM